MKKLTDVIANLKLVNKMFLIVALFGSLAVMITYYSVNQLNSVDSAYRALLTRDVDAAILMSEVQADLREASRTVYAVLTEQQAQTMRAAQHELDTLQRELVSKVEQAMILMPHEKIRLQTIFHAQINAFRVGADVIEAAARWRGDRALNIIHEELDPQLERLSDVLNALQRDTVENYLSLSSDLGQQTRQTILTTTLAIILALLLGLGLAALLSVRVISRPIMTLTQVMRNLSNHQHREPIPYTHRQDEVGQMAQALQVFREDSERNEELEKINRDIENARILAERTAEAKSTFLATMSHEIRTPMNAIIVLARLALKQSQDSAQRHRLQRILGASEHLLHILNDILDFSKIDAGQMVIESVAFHPNDLLQTVEGMITDSAAQKGLTLHFQGVDADSYWVRGDAFRISQILINYASNAVKFSNSGTITISLTLEQSDQTSYLRGEVRDQGIGMNAEQISALFQPFQQTDASISRRYGGTGLGLAICRNLTELMGGQVGATSTADTGSVFWFQVPVAILDQAEQPQNKSTLPLERTDLHQRQRSVALRLLLVDDNALNREVGKELLELLGTQVELAHDGPHALQILQAHPVDYFSAVLMDLMMPTMDGLQTTRHIRNLPGFSHLPIIALSANASPQDVALCRAAGMNAHVSKPIDEQLLWDALSVCFVADASQISAGDAEPRRAPILIEDQLAPPSQSQAEPLSVLRLTTDNTVFQPSKLLSLAESMHQPNLDRLIDLVQADLQELSLLLEKEDLLQHPELLSRLAHDLISTCGHTGMIRTGQATHLLHQSIASPSSQALESSLDQVQQEFALAKQAFNRWNHERTHLPPSLLS